jgi:DNA-binding NtrC family response regulator
MTGGSCGTVLVVDDEPAIRLLCRVNLQLDGYAVLEAATLAAAREALAAGGVDVVLLDLHLGNERSEALIAECAAADPRVPVVLVTGSAEAAAARRVGADAVLPKPFEIEALAATVSRLVSAPAAASTR